MKINKNPSSKELRQFLGMWIVAVSAFGGLALWRHHPSLAHGAWIVAAVIGAPGLIISAVGRGVYRIWMTFAFGINYVVTRVLLTLVYCGILTPLAILFKLVGRDVLRIKKPSPNVQSYWDVHPRISDVEYYRHLY